MRIFHAHFIMKQWPRKGSKIEFIGVRPFWFKNIIESAETLLEAGKEYTVAKLHIASSWCGVEVEEFPGVEFALGFFKHPKELTTSEVREEEERTYDRSRD